MNADMMAQDATVTVVCSNIDPASQNIKRALLGMRQWLPSDNGFVYKKWRVVEIDGELVAQDGIDKRFEAAGIRSKLIIFASRHRSKDARPMLTVHHTGNTGNAVLGGRDRELATAAPQAMRSLLRSLKLLAENDGFEVTIEATHHGPSNLAVPSLFIEIGCTEKEWNDPAAGHMVATAILLLNDGDSPVAVGFGGNHYAPRQNSLILETDVTFGHVFPSYTLDNLDESLIRQAFEKSRADFAYFDRKAMSSEQKDRLGGIIKSLGFEVLKESQIREMEGVPWGICREMRSKAAEICPSAHPVMTSGIKCELSKTACKGNICPKVKVARIDPELLEEAEKLDRTRLRDFLETNRIAYVEYDDGRFAHVLIGIDDDCARMAAERLTKECLDILREHYEVEFDREHGMIYIVERSFSPERACALGISPGPMFKMLTDGKPVETNGKTILPEMVYEINKRAIKLRNVRI